MRLIKRDGTSQEFCKDKIVKAIESAGQDINVDASKVALKIADSIEEIAKTKDSITVEEIQDIVEKKLMASNKKDVAKQYIKYRYDREKIRLSKTKLMNDVREKLMATNVENQNANLDERSFSGRMNEANRVVMKDYALNNCMSKMARDNHLNNEIYIHDLDSYASGMHNCCARETKFCTADDGVHSFEDYSNGDEVKVISHLGKVQKAKVKSYGRQKLNKITFSLRGQRFVTERFTSNHRWILSDGSETSSLKVGDKLYKAPVEVRKFSSDEASDEESNKYNWTVVDIQEDKEEEVWCLEVENDHSFVLPSGIVTGNCLSIPFDDLLKNGFKVKQTDVRPPKSVNTAMQLIAVIKQLQSLQEFGGVSATHLDWTMVPFVRMSFAKHFLDGIKYLCDENIEYSKDELFKTPIDSPLYKEQPKAYRYALDMTEKETHQAVEGMYHNLNTLQSRSGQQLPFSSINYGTCTLPEGRMVIKALLDVSIEGLGALHKTPIFPCGIFQCMEGVNRKPGDPNYDLFKLALESTSKRLYPNYANCDWSGNAGYDKNDPRTYFSTMGCRTANGADINALPGQNPQLKDGRGNICPVTIIMPTLAMEAKEKTEREGNYVFISNGKSGMSDEIYKEEIIKNFMEILDQKIHEAKDMLLERFELIASQPPESARFMYENNTMYGYVPEEGIRSALKHGTLAVGQLGLAETLQILIGTNQLSEDGMKLAKEIESLFNKRCKEFKEEYRLNFGVYYTPAENLCHTALKKFRDKYGVIPNVSDREFFTNSMHVPVWEKIDPFHKIDIESQLTGYSNAGCITYVELESTSVHNLEAMEVLVNYAMDHDIPYFAINVPNDQCMDCGSIGEYNDICPVCGSSNIKRLRRVTGYLTNDYTTTFNEGKKQEVTMRVTHDEVY